MWWEWGQVQRMSGPCGGNAQRDTWFCGDSGVEAADTHQGDGPLAGVEAPKPPRLTLIAWAQTPSPKCSPSPRSECFRGCLWTRHRGEGPGHGWTGKEDTGGVKGNPPPCSV